MFSWLVYNSICALPIALLGLLARRFLRRAPAVEHALWLCVLVRLVLPPLPALEGPAPDPAAGILSSGAPSWGNVAMARITRALGSGWSNDALRLALVLFGAALLWILVREATRVRRVERCVTRARAASERLLSHVRGVASGLGVPPPRLRIASGVPGPFLWSLRRRPVLVLPEGPELPPPTVLAHEFAHLRRRDHWTAWLELAVLGLHFWNPLFWLARRRLHRAAELACDAWALERFPAERRAFAGALVSAVERAAAGAPLPRAIQAIGMDGRDFEERLERILGSGPGPATRAPLAGFGVVLLIGLATLPGLGAPSLAAFRGSLPALPASIDDTTWRELLEHAEADLRAHPLDGAAHASRGMACLGLARFEDALASFRRQEELGFQPAKALYNQACVHARAGAPAEALDCLALAAEQGFAVSTFAAHDPDLASLRDDPRFRALALLED